MDHSELISRLKFIGKIQRGDKINVKHMFIQPESFITKLSRTLFNIDDRANTFIFLTSILGKSFDLLTAQLENTREPPTNRGNIFRGDEEQPVDIDPQGGRSGKKGKPRGMDIESVLPLRGYEVQPRKDSSSYSNILSINLSQDLRNSIVGLKNLKLTYEDDKLFCCKMDVMLEEVSARIIELETRYDFLKETSSSSDKKVDVSYIS